jgi:Holliday junction resolvase YEN1
VFDGPNKPPFKRNKRTGPNVASIPEFLAKQLLKQFALPFHVAPGEAEAECALLQREGVVDAVLSEDVDTLMFGSGITFRNWTPETKKSGSPTHVNVYDAKATKAGSGLDREGMILIALMSGGDYIPEGIPGCGPKTACEAARAGFGADLCKISRKDKTSLRTWRERLAYELRTNESKFFKRKHAALVIPEDFPNSEVLGYYTHPCISPPDKVIRLQGSLKWDEDLNFAELRTFTAEAFDWTKLGGAKKFIRNLAPALLVRELRMQNQNEDTSSSNDIEYVQQREGKLINAIHGKRNHISTDAVTELRVSFTPHTLVPIDLDAEEPDDEIPIDSGDEDLDDGNGETGEAPPSPSKKRAPSNYDPTIMEKLWVFETYVKVGVPLKLQDWEESLRDVRRYVALKHASKETATKTSKSRGKATKSAKSTMPQGTLDRFTRVTKPGQLIPGAPAKLKPSGIAPELEESTHFSSPPPPCSQTSTFRIPPSFALSVPVTVPNDIINLLSSSPAAQIPSRSANVPTLSPSMGYELPSSITKRRRSPLRRTQTDTAVLNLVKPRNSRPTTPPGLNRIHVSDSPNSLPSPSLLLPTKKAKRINTAGRESKKHNAAGKTQNGASKEVSSPPRQKDITQYFSPSKQRKSANSLQGRRTPPLVSRKPISQVVEELDLTDSPAQPRVFLRKNEREQSRNGNDAESSRTSLVEIQPNLVESLSQERHARVSSMALCETSAKTSSTASCVESTGISCQNTESLDLTGECEDSADCHNARAYNSTSLPLPLPREPRAKQLKKTAKEVIRVRESLDGAFAIEQIDLSGDGDAGMARVHAAAIGARKLFRMSEVSVLDLTGD